jgi:hypothetical protein
MNCPGSEEIAACADGRLEAAETERLLDHCSECDDCRRELAIVTQAHPPQPVPAELKARTVKAIVRSLERERDRTPLRLRLLPRERKHGFGWAAAAAILVTVAGMIGLVKMLETRDPEPRRVVKQAPTTIPDREAPRPERVAPETQPPKTEETPKPPVVAPPPNIVQPKIEKNPKPAPEATPDPVTPPPPPKFEETRPEDPPARPSHTIVARALLEVQVTDVTGAVTVRRKGAKEKDKEKLGSVARLSEGDVLAAEKGASFRIEGRHPVVLGERTSVSLAFAPQEQAPYIQIRSGEAMVDSTDPTGWVVSDGRIAVVLKQARARFATSPGEDRLRITALTEPIYAQPDGGQMMAIRMGEELQVARGSAELSPLDAAVIAKKLALFDSARPRQRTFFYTSCDPADANRGHFFVQEGLWFRNEALLSKENPKDRSLSVVISPNPRFAWREGLLVRFRFMTNVKDLQFSLRVDERRYTLYRGFPVDRKAMNQWIPVELPLAPLNAATPNGLGFRRDDGQMQLTITSNDKFDSIRFTARIQEVFGDQKPYFLIDDIQVVEKEKE